MIIQLKKIKKQNIVTVLCSSRIDQILTIWHFHTTTPNSDLNINNNMANKKIIKNYLEIIFENDRNWHSHNQKLIIIIITLFYFNKVIQK